MKITEARREAKLRWGVMAFANISRTGFKKYMVGKWVTFGRNSIVKDIYGTGNTWEEAFASATKKGN